MMNLRNLGLFGCLVAVAVVGIAAVPSSSPAPSSPAPSSPVAADPAPRRAISSLGRLEPAGRVMDVGGPSDARLRELLVAEGDWVEAGQELFRLDAYPERGADRELAAARLEDARRRLQAESELAEQAIRDATTALHRVEQLEPVEIEAQEARVAVLVARFENESQNLERKVSLGDAVAREALDDQRALVTECDKNLAAARADLRAQRVAHEMNLAQARADLQRSELMLQRANVLYSPVGAERELSQAEARVEAAVIRAPRAGQILKLLASVGERIGAAPVLQLGNTREMHVVAEVYETDVMLVEAGQRATIHSPTLAESVTGEVVQIGLLVFKNDILDVDPLADVDTRVVEVRIRLDDAAPVARLTNLEVDVDIHLPAAEGR
ncbi:MAG: HlyD family efflux transporter periplasmic adaptor subunit [Planctomycetota bacterium]